MIQLFRPKTSSNDLEHLNKQELQALAIHSSDKRIKVLAYDLLMKKYI